MVTEAHGIDGAAVNKGRETRPMSVTFSDMPSEPFPMTTTGLVDGPYVGVVDARGAVQAPGAVTHPIVVEATTVADEFADGFTRYNRPVGGGVPQKRVMLFETRNADDVAAAKAFGAE
jgi:hypothetical protein